MVLMVGNFNICYGNGNNNTIKLCFCFNTFPLLILFLHNCGYFVKNSSYMNWLGEKREHVQKHFTGETKNCLSQIQHRFERYIFLLI